MEKKLSLPDVARYPRPGLRGPRRVEFTPDGSTIAYLYSAEGTLVQGLWTYDVATGERRPVSAEIGAGAASSDTFSIDEELRRERSRVRELGVAGYQFVRGDGPVTRHSLVLLVSLGGWLYVRRGDGGLERLEGSEGTVDARLNADGSGLAFVREDELHVAFARDGFSTAHRLTDGAGNGTTNGLAEYIAQEEMDRSEGYWWSPNGSRLAYVQVDSSHIPLYPIVHQGKEGFTVEEHRYPFAGGPNARVRLGVVAATPGATTTWMDLGDASRGDASRSDEQDIYLARVAWRPDGVLTAQIESRDQCTLRLVAFDSATGRATTLIEEHGDPWLNLGDEARFLKSGEILWGSERGGFRHLYLHDSSGQMVRVLTEGQWIVTRVLAVDEERRAVYFQGTRDSVLERHLYAVSLDGGPIRRLTEGAGWHDAVVSPDFTRFVDNYSHLGAAPALTLRLLDDGAPEAVLYEDAEAGLTALGLREPELTSLHTRDGVLLHAAVYMPPTALEPGQRYPLVVAVYGGPGAQTVANKWDLTVDLRAQYLAQQGFVVLKVDGRGSASRGLAFEAAIARRMGHVEVEDQVEGVRFLAQRPNVDGDRVGIYGWSYGGYMTCKALMRAPDVFKVGVAGAPVTHWEGYDTHYTERYMGAPGSNAAGYHDSAVMPYAGELRGKLLLVHGMVDENVHFRHTARLIAALTAAQKQYDLLLFPEERHMPRDAADLEYLERRLIEHFQRYL